MPLLLLLLTALLLTACAPRASVSIPVPTALPTLLALPTPAPPVTIAFVSLDYDPTRLRKVEQEFEQQYPGIAVALADTGEFTGPLKLAWMGARYDCFTAALPIADAADAAALYDLLPLIETDPAFSTNDYPAVLLEPYRRDNHLLGLPDSYTLRTLTYNATAFAQAGLPAPTAEWTPDDFLAAAQALTSGNGSSRRYGYVPLGFPIDDLLFFVRQQGATLVRGSGAQTRPNYTDPQVVAAIQWYLDLHTRHNVMPAPVFPHRSDTPHFDTSVDLIQQGRAGMWFDRGYGMFRGPQARSSSADTPDFEVRIAPLPIGGAGLTAEDRGYATGLHISATTAHPHACWDWLRYLTHSTSLLRWSIPARRSVARSSMFLAAAPPDTADLVETSLRTLDAAATLPPPDHQFPHDHIETYWLLEAITRALDEHSSLASELEQAQATTTAFLNCVAAKETSPATCARRVDPDYHGYLTDSSP